MSVPPNQMQSNGAASTAQSTSPLSVSQLGSMLNGQTQGTPVAMQQTTGNTSANNFMNTGNFSVPFGSGINTGLAQQGQNWAESQFANDPNMALAVQQGQAAIQNNYAARGLNQSGAMGQAISQNLYNNYLPYLQGAQNQYNTATNSIGSAYGNYQTQLASLANTGLAANSTNAANQNSAGQSLSQLLAGANLNTGQNISQANLGTSSNISSLLANQGVLGASAFLNTGAAQSNNVFNGMSLAAQMGAQAQASQANNQGSQQGSGGIGSSGGMF